MKRTIDIAPSWAAITPALLDMLEHNGHRDNTELKKELTRMAALADLWVKHEKTSQSKSRAVKIWQAKIGAADEN